MFITAQSDAFIICKRWETLLSEGTTNLDHLKGMTTEINDLTGDAQDLVS